MCVNNRFFQALFLSATLALTSFSALQANPVVSVVPVSKEVISPTAMVSGQVQSRHASELSAGVNGKLVWIAEPGTAVAEGGVLAEVDARPYELAVRQLEAQLKRKNIEIERTKRDLERLSDLYQKQAISAREIDNMQADLALLQSDEELLQLQLEQAQDDLKKTTVRAPFAGVVTERLQRAGEDVTGTAPLLGLVDVEHLEIRFHGPLAYSDFTRQAAQVSVYYSGGDTRMPLRTVIPVSDARSQTFTGVLKIPADMQGAFRVGELVTVAVPAALPAEHFVVPRDALVIGKGTTSVYVIDSENKAQEVKVSIAGGSGDYVNVVGKLQNGQRVVVRGADTLRHGQMVKVLSTREFPLTTIGS
ncbi:efflux RND transporter periplasmic adaptor subunit [Pseudidiomarina insulisalsae]|uniref:Efflux RND transporter periplasmic adaptor subunit n=1 Tax=Pseudidiomarina insulisalsae TaxID=575789 RepID=A0A432YQ03_9GAMM|nr:efflux RND transporter periplasmic adaptor subunit [Pseudidiomarina insulisalsae]RUO63159.1 hypothetical protein CWI71_02745 [Pseudidiomarina insulisalsae]